MAGACATRRATVGPGDTLNESAEGVRRPPGSAGFRGCVRYDRPSVAGRPAQSAATRGCCCSRGSWLTRRSAPRAGCRKRGKGYSGVAHRPSAACDLHGLRTPRSPGSSSALRACTREGAHSMDSSESVRFDLADGTSVAVESNDLRRVYEDLWKLSSVPGVVSTAALLLDGACRHPRHRVNLNSLQSAALRRALDGFAG